MAFIFQCDKLCSCCSCILFTLCCLVNPWGLAVWTVCTCCCGFSKNAWTRYKLRKRLKISGALWEDCLIHCSLLSSLAWCQEAHEISAAGYKGIIYQVYDQYQAPIVPMAPVTNSCDTGASLNSPLVSGSTDGSEIQLSQQRSSAPRSTSRTRARQSQTRDDSDSVLARPLVDTQLLHEIVLGTDRGVESAASAS